MRRATEINFVKEISAKAHGDGYMSFSSNFWLDFVTVWGVIRLNLEPAQKADCISRIFIPKIDSPGAELVDDTVYGYTIDGRFFTMDLDSLQRGELSVDYKDLKDYGFFFILQKWLMILAME